MTTRRRRAGCGRAIMTPSESFFSAMLPNQFRQRPVIADEVLRSAREVRELGRRNIIPQTLVQCGEDAPKMNWPASRLLAPARARTEDLVAPEAAPGQERTGN